MRKASKSPVYACKIKSSPFVLDEYASMASAVTASGVSAATASGVRAASGVAR